tara:strand:+ start:2347 stop:3195 length:849 start_codon:yes stop_codon:yes gene_type:complete
MTQPKIKKTPCIITKQVFISIMVLIILLSVVSCSSKQTIDYVERPVNEIYNNAMDLMYQSNYVLAAEQFDEVERQHPYSLWATKAQIMAAYNHYQSSSYDEAIIAAQRFIELHPGHKDVGYAHYLIAVCYYEQISDVGRDQSITQLALASLDEVVRRFPETTYARDAKLKTDLARDHLAGKEMSIGRYYLNKGHFVAALNRFRSVIEQYQTTSHVPEALHRLVETYLSLGVALEAKAAGAVLGYNYPGSRWYQDSYQLLVEKNLSPEKNKNSWIQKTFESLF